jgi:hypothetical protein
MMLCSGLSRFSTTRIKSVLFTCRQSHSTTPRTRDLENLKVVLICDTDSLVLVSSARRLGDISDIDFDKEFLEEVSSGSHIHFLGRQYRIPVLNRGEQVEFQMLVTNLKGKWPMAWATCEHPGVKFQPVKLVPALWGEPRETAAITGSALALVACYPL